MAETYYVVPQKHHNELIEKAYRHRGYTAEEAKDGARFCELASAHGIRTHNGIKALHLDEMFGSKVGGCVPGATLEKLPTKFKAVQRWNANKKLGQSVAFEAMDTCMRLADEFGVGVVAVDNAFHYLWGGGYVIEAANKGYIAYTNCTSALAEVVPFGGKSPTLGTNPHSWGFPTTDAIGYPICVDWATSTIAMGRVQQLKREGKPLPANCAVDKDGHPTTDPDKAVALLPFGAHKGYGLGLIDELYGAFIGGSLPTIRGRYQSKDDEKHTPSFFFQCVRPEAISGGAFAKGRSQRENVKAVIRDILGHGNEKCLLPGQPEAQAAALTKKHGGLLFSNAEIEAFNEIAHECGAMPWDIDTFKTPTV
ncbi:MAG TPA: Ldh family oxidoreductase [Verrucomicrobiae bacterium]|nr:Ldh family oxidoreductase [Verrucomicrobiae bacterium]